MLRYPRTMLDDLVMILFGDVRVAFAARVLGALAHLSPCVPPAADACAARHAEVASVVVVVALEDRDPEGAAALLLGLGVHETRFRTRVQAEGGPARSWWQVEPVGRGVARRADAAALELDAFYAARRALALARGGMGAYACGKVDGCPRAAAELRRYVTAAQYALR